MCFRSRSASRALSFFSAAGSTIGDDRGLQKRTERLLPAIPIPAPLPRQFSKNCRVQDASEAGDPPDSKLPQGWQLNLAEQQNHGFHLLRVSSEPHVKKMLLT